MYRITCQQLLSSRWDIRARKSIAPQGWDIVLPQNVFQGTGTSPFWTMTTCICILYTKTCKLSDQISWTHLLTEMGGLFTNLVLLFLFFTKRNIKWMNYYYLQPSPIFFHFGKVVQSCFVNSELWTKHMQKKMLLVLIEIYSQRYPQ